MIVNGKKLLEASPIVDMLDHKATYNGVSHGLAETDYDVRIRQTIRLGRLHPRFALASTVERFKLPPNLCARVHDKSSWARRGLSVFNTVIEPGWEGYLTLELVYHGEGTIEIEEGSGIAQVIFEEVAVPANYAGKYQGQEDRPVPAILA